MAQMEIAVKTMVHMRVEKLTLKYSTNSYCTNVVKNCMTQ
ncbi:hypothetical protein DSUL_20321 [Desulfovibrionales bacterium]